MKLKRICFITDGYPSETREANAFVETLVNEVVDMDIECVVIAPQSISKSIKAGDRFEKSYRTRLTVKGNTVDVYCPKYISASVRKIGEFNTAYITLNNYKRAAEKVFKRLHKEKAFDAVYGHFIFPAGIMANYLGEKYDLPSFFAYGENTTYSIDYLGEKATRELLKSINGVVAVSSENKRVLINHNIVDASKISVFPNSIQNAVFYHKDRIEQREKLGFDKDDFIVGFVGRFCDIKGPDRLERAVDECEPGIKVFYIGTGDLKPNQDKALFVGKVEHSKIADYLNAADIFVLPTLAEGCCNAIIEALACGLPVVSSNLPFNDDILDDSCSIRVDTTSVTEISKAIQKLKNDGDLRGKMSLGALEKAAELTIDKRAMRILEFMNEKV